MASLARLAYGRTALPALRCEPRKACERTVNEVFAGFVFYMSNRVAVHCLAEAGLDRPQLFSRSRQCRGRASILVYQGSERASTKLLVQVGLRGWPVGSTSLLAALSGSGK